MGANYLGILRRRGGAHLSFAFFETHMELRQREREKTRRRGRSERERERDQTLSEEYEWR